MRARPGLARLVAGSACAVALMTRPADAPAQTERACTFASTRSVDMQTRNGRRIAYIGKPHLVCNDGAQVWADSAVSYTSENWVHFMRKVRFLDATRELLSDDAQYFTLQGRLQAQGSLFVRDTLRGSTIEHGALVYERDIEIRFGELMVVTAREGEPRPQMTFRSAPAAPDSGDTAPPVDTVSTPFVVDADRLETRGEGRFKAKGSVEIRRGDILAFADSADFARETGLVVLDGSSRVQGGSFDLTGRRIEVATAGSELREVRALRDALLVGKDVRVAAPDIRILMTGGLMQRLVAVPIERAGTRGQPVRDSAAAARPVVLAQSMETVADSIQIDAPGEVLERVFAAGHARGESQRRDSLNVAALPPVARKDWLEGDTVIASFRPVAGMAVADDSAQARYELSQVVAKVGARSLYRLPPSDSTARAGVDPPAISYTEGNVITIELEGGDVQRMNVEGLTQGLHLEPARARVAADSISTPPDTTAATARRRPGGGHAPGGGARR